MGRAGFLARPFHLGRDFGGLRVLFCGRREGRALASVAAEALPSRERFLVVLVGLFFGSVFWRGLLLGWNTKVLRMLDGRRSRLVSPAFSCMLKPLSLALPTLLFLLFVPAVPMLGCTRGCRWRTSNRTRFGLCVVGAWGEHAFAAGHQRCLGFAGAGAFSMRGIRRSRALIGTSFSIVACGLRLLRSALRMFIGRSITWRMNAAAAHLWGAMTQRVSVV